MFDIDYLTDSLNYSKVSSTNLTTGSQDATSSNADNLDELAELQALQRQEQVGTEKADRLGLAFPSLNLILGVSSASIGSSISVGSTPPVSAGSIPSMSQCTSPIYADRHSISTGKSHDSASRPTGFAGRPVSTGRPSGSADRTPVPAGRILGKFTASASSDRFPRASNVENLDIHEFSGPDANNLESSLDVSSTITKRINNIHLTSQVLGDINSPVQTRRQVKHKGSSESAFISYIHDQRRNNHTDFQLCMFSCFLSQVEPTTVAQALADPDWVEAMQAEMQQFRNQKVWFLVTLPDEKRAIGTKWILKNKRDAMCIVCRNKARVYQMDVKSAFLYGKIAEEAYVTQPRDFEDPYHPKKVYKVVKALYGLHQAPRDWYERLFTFLLKHGYRKGTIDKTLFIKKNSKDIMLSEIEMSSMGPLTFFLGLQVDQRPDGIFIHQEKYVADILKKFDLDNSKLASTPFKPQKIRENNVPDEPIGVHLYRSMIGFHMYLTATRPYIMFAIFKYLTAYPKLGLWYPRDSPFDLEAFSDSDYAGANRDRKSTTGGCQFLGRRLIFWQCKKQTIVATSSCEAEYVAAASCCGQ
nr:hypothetical protein [Tanacetum cinerariifolium]